MVIFVVLKRKNIILLQEMKSRLIILIIMILFCASCTNNPYPRGETAKNIYFGSFDETPTKLDPARAYYVHEAQIIDQIYEPPLTYHYLKRPYEIIPLTAEKIPEPVYYDASGNVIQTPDPPAENVAKVVYTIRIKKGIMYQNHPCFARDANGNFIYRNVKLEDIKKYESPADFEHQGTRELVAQDYVLQIRRLADPRLTCPIFSTIEQYIDGMTELQQAYTKMLEQIRSERKRQAGAGYNQEQDERNNPIILDYMAPELKGVKILDAYTFQIILKRKYPQILYWLCMHFFCPMPQEALDFYSQPAMVEKQFSINRWPVGTGPYYLKTFRPNELIVLERNPNYHADYYPAEGEEADRTAGLLADAGKQIPFIQTQYYRMEKEYITDWHKFLSGYLDASGIAGDVFDQAISISRNEGPQVSEEMRARGIRLLTDIEATLFYISFNMLDNVVGGYDEKKRKLRQAISIVVDSNKFLEIFRNGRGIPAQGPIPPGIFGYREGKDGVNPYICDWDEVRKCPVRKPVEYARKLLAEAGYPGGIGPDGKQLTLYYDHSQSGDTAFRSYFEWLRKRIALLGIRLEERGTDLTRYREKRQQGNWQIGSGGWLADYPDPENFLFLFYGPNREAQKDGPNMTNYENPEYDALFRKMESMANTPERMEIITKMVDILQRDAPAVWHFHPVTYVLANPWYVNVKPHQMSYNVMKYRKIIPELRVQQQAKLNKPVYFPVVVLVGLLIISLIPATIGLYRREMKGQKNAGLYSS
jgi:ABC-type transport system substrate-binding protein